MYLPGPDPQRGGPALRSSTRFRPPMLPPDRIPVWTHWRRRRFLDRFRRDLAAYRAAVRYEAFPFRVVEDDEARELRRELEGRLGRCRRIVQVAGGVSLRRLAPAETTGEVVEVDLVRDAFDLHRHNLGLDELDTALARTQERYAAGRGRAWARTLNPLYWLDVTLSVAADLPFVALKLVGGRPGAAARSRPGRLVRRLIRVAVLVAGAWFALRLAGLDDDVARLVRTVASRAVPSDALP